MTFNVGDWVELPNQSIARVVEISGDQQMVHVERPGGGATERPMSYASSHWRRLPVDGLRVATEKDPEAIHKRATKEPVELVVLALIDEDGSATTRQLKDILERVIGPQAFPAWWKRTQKQLDLDARIDTREALQHRYRLVREGERIGLRWRPLLSDRKRGDRIVADAPRLLEARERVKTKEALDSDVIADLRDSGRHSAQRSG